MRLRKLLYVDEQTVNSFASQIEPSLVTHEGLDWRVKLGISPMQGPSAGAEWGATKRPLTMDERIRLVEGHLGETNELKLERPRESDGPDDSPFGISTPVYYAEIIQELIRVDIPPSQSSGRLTLWISGGGAQFRDLCLLQVSGPLAPSLMAVIRHGALRGPDSPLGLLFGVDDSERGAGNFLKALEQNEQELAEQGCHISPPRTVFSVYSWRWMWGVRGFFAYPLWIYEA